MEYGDLSIESQPLRNFQGGEAQNDVSSRPVSFPSPYSRAAVSILAEFEPLRVVSSRDVQLAIALHHLEEAKRKLQQTDSLDASALLEQAQREVAVEIDSRKIADRFFRTLIEGVTGEHADVVLLMKHHPHDFDCLRTAVESITQVCVFRCSC